MLNKFIENEELLQCDTFQCADIPYTFVSKINGVTSYLDDRVTPDILHDHPSTKHNFKAAS